ncbi:leucine-rich repeat-containing protein 74B-like [Montipora foliosa]|uniref:leucine-rich repeat-containing protein 74B-like n=1 Tax=Montipora foliosa TaxID=591990 RepID=UPI0035F110A9
MPHDPRLRGTPRIARSPKITSPGRLSLGAKSRVSWTTEKTNITEKEEAENAEKEAVAVKNPIEYFKMHRKCEQLDFTGCILALDTTCKISCKLESCVNLVRLCLANSHMEDKSGEALAKGLQGCCLPLKELDMSGNTLGKNAMSALGEMLNLGQNLEKLNISRNDLTDQDVEIFLNCFSGKNGLKDLDLSSNILCDQTAKRLCVVLENNLTLEKLSIASNQLEASGLLAMQPGLRKNRTLLYLNISWNYLYDTGAEILGEIIGENESLTEISACGNLFSESAANWLAKGVANNSKLKILSIGHNLLRNLGAYEFLNVLFETNSTAIVLEMLDINGTLVDRGFRELIEIGLPEKMCSLKIVNFSVVEHL